MLTQSELTAMRTTVTDSLPGTATIQTQAYVSDGGGGGSVAWSAAGTVPCRIAPLSGDEDVIGGRISAEASSVMTFPYGTAIDAGSRVLYDGGTFNVEAVRERLPSTSVRAEVLKEA